MPQLSLSQRYGIEVLKRLKYGVSEISERTGIPKCTVSRELQRNSMSREMGSGYRNLLYLRHELMANAFLHRPTELLADAATESDEMYQNSGEKGTLHPLPEDPPRRRANKKKGAGHLVE